MMKKNVFVLLLVSFITTYLFPMKSSAVLRTTSVLIYSYDEFGKLVFLVGKNDEKKDWGDFGGWPNSREKKFITKSRGEKLDEVLENLAMRKFNEETVYYFCRENEKMISEQEALLRNVICKLCKMVSDLERKEGNWRNRRKFEGENYWEGAEKFWSWGGYGRKWKKFEQDFVNNEKIIANETTLISSVKKKKDKDHNKFFYSEQNFLREPPKKTIRHRMYLFYVEFDENLYTNIGEHCRKVWEERTKFLEKMQVSKNMRYKINKIYGAKCIDFAWIKAEELEGLKKLSNENLDAFELSKGKNKINLRWSIKVFFKEHITNMLTHGMLIYKSA